MPISINTDNMNILFNSLGLPNVVEMCPSRTPTRNVTPTPTPTNTATPANSQTPTATPTLTPTKAQIVISGNYANYNLSAVWDDITGNVTTVGTNGRPSFYGTYDQSGNVDQWNDLDNTPNSVRGFRGGGWNDNSFNVSSSYRNFYHPSFEYGVIGFRLASLLNPLGLPNFVNVGDPGNAADTGSLYGAVIYNYKIGSLLVTNNEYIDFLRAVASTDTYLLYHVGMNSSRGGITRSGSSPSYTYAVKTNYGNKPVAYVSWFDCARYCNWLSNNKLTGVQNSTTTEDGAYYLNGRTTGDAVAVNVINPNTPGLAPTYRLPTENEWYKAAYYKGGGINAGYWAYATQSNIVPISVCATPEGDGTPC